MDRQSLIDKISKARVLVDEALVDAYGLDNHWESVYHAEQVLDAIDAFLNYLKGDDFHD